MSAGARRYRFAFDQRSDVDDGAGAVEGEFEERFQEFCQVTPRFAGESVQAARLEGMATFTIQVPASSNTRQVTPDWRCRDVRSGPTPDKQMVYAIVSGPIDVEGGKGRTLEFLMQTGKAA